MKRTIDPCAFVPVATGDFIGPAGRVAALLEARALKLLSQPKGTAKLLFYGAPGTGKTAMANAFASRLAGHPTQIESVNGRNVNVNMVRHWQESNHYLPLYGKFTVKVVNECDLCPQVAQDALLTYLDEMKGSAVFIGTSNLDLKQLVPRFQSRLQQFKIEAPDTAELSRLLQTWNAPERVANMIAVGSGGNVRAALLDLQSWLDSREANRVT